ncbi:amidohydrolase family protein [Pyxidicoccus xibeiensis]|uniref:amidohydrolase family protein n=1 Tax=Pyxidicoccus xibeiensis TaxID=2906759 RepID=UPI0020A6E569|nr:amidohydrolase family protein [Pyxidicoccus xibeiensis]MCP3139852.1 amidohydrolase family protein [Pyxidicoccus xibeiensis]
MTVLPMTTGTDALEDQTVLVAGERIVAMGPSASTPVPEGTTRVDGRGRWLMPGLADMHLHLQPGTGMASEPAGQQLRLLLANGVTTARALGAAPTGLELRARVAKGEVLGPRLLVAGPSFHAKSVKGPEHARERVREQKAAGFDLLKTHGGLGRETYDAMMDEARAQGLRVSGHVTPDVGLAHALASGQQLEHLDGWLAALLPPGDVAKVDQLDFSDALQRMDPARIPALAQATKKAGVWSSPTLDLFELLASADRLDTLRARPELRYAPPAAVEAWTKALSDPELKDAPAARRKRFVELRRQVVRGLHAAGAGLLVGSDSPQLFMVTGFAVHREMEAMAEAGVPAWAVLEAATRDAAEALGESSDWGTVAPGQRADLLLLDADPRVDVRHTRDLHGVLLRGRWLPRAELDAMLEEVAAAVKAPKP